MTDATTSNRPMHMAEPPLSRATQVGAGLCLIIGAALNAVPQYLQYLMAGDLERKQQIAWGLEHQGFYRVEWLAAMIGSFLLLLGFLGVLQVTRWSTPKLTAVAAAVLLWGMTGQIFSDVGTYTAQVVAADIFGTGDAERLIDAGYLRDPGMIGGVIVPVIAGMFFGVLLLAAACWRSGFPKAAITLLALYPLWDFFGPAPLGPFTTDLLLLAGGCWLGWTVLRLRGDAWRSGIR